MRVLTYVALLHSVIAGGIIIYTNYSEKEKRIQEYEEKLRKIESDVEKGNKILSEKLEKLQEENAYLKCKNDNLVEINKNYVAKFHLLGNKLKAFKNVPTTYESDSESDEDLKLVDACKSRLVSIKNELNEMVQRNRIETENLERDNIVEQAILPKTTSPPGKIYKPTEAMKTRKSKRPVIKPFY